ncbi:hypothetical protein AVEN_250499-1 [Araneus ventricosus]|uniref:Uncharacterized protein n=1 Tax=Araneus ventricosus TaxID=182803 RepID=A0A4Y2FGD0_ARAVE|nr:hypothetical protein AVEN_250499-1 [Araneus ventricosus]
MVKRKTLQGFRMSGPTDGSAREIQHVLDALGIMSSDSVQNPEKHPQRATFAEVITPGAAATSIHSMGLEQPKREKD